MSVANLHQGVEFVLVRHAESESNAEIHAGKDKLSTFQDAQLTDTGRRQALATCEYLTNKLPIDNVIGVWTSAQQRAWNTAQPLMDSGFLELFTTVHSIHEYRTEDKGVLSVGNDFKLTIDYTWDMFVHRVRDFMIMCVDFACKQPMDILSRRPVVLVFGHSLFFSAFLEMVIGRTPQSATDITFHLPNTSLSSVFYNPCLDKWSIYQVGALHHLEEGQRIRHSKV